MAGERGEADTHLENILFNTYGILSLNPHTTLRLQLKQVDPEVFDSLLEVALDAVSVCGC